MFGVVHLDWMDSMSQLMAQLCLVVQKTLTEEMEWYQAWYPGRGTDLNPGTVRPLDNQTAA